jgi:hypothetical protein
MNGDETAAAEAGDPPELPCNGTACDCPGSPAITAPAIIAVMAARFTTAHKAATDLALIPTPFWARKKQIRAPPAPQPARFGQLSQAGRHLDRSEKWK